ncbi:ABC transporter permease [Rhodopirellula sp. MGV]|uniref:ABC transporter permease n=1 Tax=Rhodopirellula sp. MGV TaxID=2023130 RepID=UPI000B961264|nr:ABC transporter permease [Rhodopirellula sp. MGV]OYP33059.1 ABC transporter permease [Rhodopirellula sp. MGV]PNY35568.1 ABC transporter permease [Rhodopirellula baltica]
MFWNIAHRTLVHDRGKLIVGLVGVIFSVVLVNVQGGLFIGLLQKASLLVDRGNADIWVGHRGMHNVDFAHPIPERWKYQVRAVDGVAAVEPMRIEFGEISLPDGSFEDCLIVGVTQDTELGKPYELVEGIDDPLAYPDGVVLDICDDAKLLYPELGSVREINGKRVRVVGKCEGVLSFLISPYIFMSFDQASEFANLPTDSTSYLLAKVSPGADPATVCREIEKLLPDVEAMTADEYAKVSINFWLTRTGIGLSFGAATIMGVLVGLIMVAQTLYAMVLDRLSEFATLRAIGLRDRELLRILLIQSSIVATVGIIIGIAMSVGVRELLSTPRATISIPPELYGGSAVLVFVVCLIASGLPYMRVRKVDPHTALTG